MLMSEACSECFLCHLTVVSSQLSKPSRSALGVVFLPPAVCFSYPSPFISASTRVGQGNGKEVKYDSKTDKEINGTGGSRNQFLKWSFFLMLGMLEETSVIIPTKLSVDLRGRMVSTIYSWFVSLFVPFLYNHCKKQSLHKCWKNSFNQQTLIKHL